MPRPRSHASARQAGARFERLVADYLAEKLDDRIDRRVKTGAQDKGDIAAVRTRDGQRVVIEAKNVRKMSLGVWLREAQQEAENDKAVLGVVVHKRHGVSAPGAQYVTMTLNDFVFLLGGENE